MDRGVASGPQRAVPVKNKCPHAFRGKIFVPDGHKNVDLGDIGFSSLGLPPGPPETACLLKRGPWLSVLGTPGISVGLVVKCVDFFLACQDFSCALSGSVSCFQCRGLSFSGPRYFSAGFHPFTDLSLRSFSSRRTAKRTAPPSGAPGYPGLLGWMYILGL